jgi:hypothetical protein
MRTSRSEFVERTRRAAWAFGREFRDGLLSQFKERYGILDAPPPALIIAELLTDFVDVDLKDDPLALNVQAQIEWLDGKPRVTTNSRIDRIKGVKDPGGVKNVAMWHEAVHAVRDIDAIRVNATGLLPGFEAPPRIVCYRSGPRSTSSVVWAREFWAEEAGRAAAVSHPALATSPAFCELLFVAGRSGGRVKQGWPLLYQAAHDIAVNSTALVKQLRLEGLIVTPKDTSQGIKVQTSLLESREAG